MTITHIDKSSIPLKPSSPFKAKTEEGNKEKKDKIDKKEKKEKKITRDDIDKALALFPFVVGNAIFNGYTKIFTNSHTLFSMEFCAKIIQIACFEIMGIRVSIAYVIRQFSNNFKNGFLNAPSKPSVQIAENLNEEDLGLLDDEEKERLSNKKFTKEIDDKKKTVLKKFQTHRNEMSLPKMRKKLEDFFNSSNKNSVITNDRLDKNPITDGHVNEQFILNEDKMAQEKYGNNPKAERRNNPAIMMCTMISPFLNSDLGTKLHGHREIKVNVSRFKSGHKLLRNKLMQSEPNLTLNEMRRKGNANRINPPKKLNEIEKIKNRITQKVNEQLAKYESIVSKNDLSNHQKEIEVDTIEMSTKMISDEQKRRKYAQIKDFKYLQIPMSERAEFMEYLGDELVTTINDRHQTYQAIKEQISTERNQESKSKFINERRGVKTATVNSTTSKLMSTFQATKSILNKDKTFQYSDNAMANKPHMPTYLAMNIIKSNKQKMVSHNALDFEDEFEKEIEHHKHFIQEHANAVRNEIKSHKLRIPKAFIN
jgi:hypothetical protein